MNGRTWEQELTRGYIATTVTRQLATITAKGTVGAAAAAIGQRLHTVENVPPTAWASITDQLVKAALNVASPETETHARQQIQHGYDWAAADPSRLKPIDPHRRYVVLRRDGAPVGYAGILRTGSDADVLTVAVAADHQGQGCGRLLLQELLRIAQGWNSRAVYLEVEEGNAAALALYRGSGFEPVGQRRHYYGPDRHAVTMRRQLREPMGSIPLGGGR